MLQDEMTRREVSTAAKKMGKPEGYWGAESMPAKFWTRICVHDPRSVTGPFTCAMVLWECFR